MTHAIISGAAGFIGTHLAADLLSHDIRVTALCRENRPNRNRLPAVDIVTNIENLPEADVFYHLAWENASGPGRSDPLSQSRNTELTLQALLAAHRLGCRRFIALGTVYEYLAPQIVSSGTFGGPDFYILSKSYAHAIANQLAYKLGIQFVWCRICHPIGRLIKPDQMMASVISDLLAGKTPLLGPALTPYDIIAVEDVAQGLRLLGRTRPLPRRAYYIGSASPQPLHLWLTETHRLLNATSPLALGNRPDDGLLFDKNWFDSAPLARDTGYTPQVSFAQAVANTARWIMLQALR